VPRRPQSGSYRAENIPYSNLRFSWQKAPARQGRMTVEVRGRRHGGVCVCVGGGGVRGALRGGVRRGRGPSYDGGWRPDRQRLDRGAHGLCGGCPKRGA
jgi:hypothetical protein